jgi:hypothetical protein
MTFMCTQLPFFSGKSVEGTLKIGENTDLL